MPIIDGGIDLGFTVTTRADVQELGDKVRAIAVSYPKSGRTWLRYMIGTYLHYMGIPASIAYTHDGSDGKNDPSRQGCPASAARQWYRCYPILWLVRDPRDVVVSNYFQITRRDIVFGQSRPKELTAHYSIKRFIRRDDFGIKSILLYYNIWSSVFPLFPRFLLLRYELLALGDVANVLRFLGYPVQVDILEAAIAENKFEEMYQREKDKPTESEILRPGDLSDRESFKVRKGKVGGYRDYLTKEDVRFIDYEIELAIRPDTLLDCYLPR